VKQFNADGLDALLPQTQCGQCGYAACRPYAEAMSTGAAPINRCPPGGDTVIAELAQALGVPPIALDPACGDTQPPAVAVIDEAWCIGCTLCIAVCPVDAIAGAAKRMHTVIAESCTGCELCIPPCPVDCIVMRPVMRAMDRESRRSRADAARVRFLRRQVRLPQAPTKKAIAPKQNGDRNATQAAVARALARARARLENR
jgi:electron transport complex protein RnfB